MNEQEWERRIREYNEEERLEENKMETLRSLRDFLRGVSAGMSIVLIALMVAFLLALLTSCTPRIAYDRMNTPPPSAERVRELSNAPDMYF